jgi:predicted membrane channel-forming protein YqfA (hemolysin III family)
MTITAQVGNSFLIIISGFKWYWILLIVLGGVLVIGGIVFFVCKKKTKTEDRLLD